MIELRDVSPPGATARTLEWDPVAGAAGFRFTVDGKRSHTWDASRTNVRVALAAQRVTVEALGINDTGAWVSGPAPSGFGAALYPRRTWTAGTTVDAGSIASLEDAIANAPANATVRIVGTIPLPAGGLFITRTSPLTVTGGKLTGSQLWLSGARNVRLHRIHRADGHDGVKLANDTRDCELDGLLITDMGNQGVMEVGARDMQIWNNRILRTGHTGTSLQPSQRHGMYFANLAGRSVVANNLVEDSTGYAIQIGPNARGTATEPLLFVCNTARGGTARGGFIAWAYPTDDTHGIVVVGHHADRSPVSGFDVWDSVGELTVYDSLSSGAAGQAFAGDPSRYVGCRDGAPNLARALVQQIRHRYVPPLDIDGKPRVTADAGCFAL